MTAIAYWFKHFTYMNSRSPCHKDLLWLLHLGLHVSHGQGPTGKHRRHGVGAVMLVACIVTRSASTNITQVNWKVGVGHHRVTRNQSFCPTVGLDKTMALGQ